TFRLYPNPFAGALHLTGAEGWTLRVFTSGGAAVHVRKPTGADETVHLERLPAGLYFFRLEKDGKVKTLKAVKSE
ncbi:MAG: T9SS type A sorting domain-containing protein, partial [Bacteroidales bacterium]|nr:T9SS type A sorting domain-containing protein [Bacteroidales bacterium]